MLLNQNNGYFPFLKFADSQMNGVICEVIGTYNAICIVNGNTDDVDFFRLSVEFEINAIQTNYIETFNYGLFGEFLKSHLDLEEYDDDGGLGSNPRKIKNCLNVYNINYTEFDSGRLPFDKHTAKREHQSYSNKIENELKQGKSAILSYTFNFANIHTYALRYNSENSFIAYNCYSNDDSPSNASTIINSIGDNRYFYVGYVLY